MLKIITERALIVKLVGLNDILSLSQVMLPYLISTSWLKGFSIVMNLLTFSLTID